MEGQRTAPGQVGRPTTAVARRGRIAWAVSAALVTIAARLPVLLAHRDTWLPFEIQSGSIAAALLDGLRLDHAHLPIIEHIRGSALFGYLLVPLYALFGPTAFAMKLLPLLWHAATVALLVTVLLRFSTRRVALAAGLLIVLAPPMLAKLSVLGLASHLESSLFWIAALGLVLSMQGPNRIGRGRCLVLGVIVGLSGFFHLQALLGCLLVLAMLAVTAGRRVGLTGWLLIATGMALGAAPSWLYAGGNLHFLQLRATGVTRTPDSATRLLIEAARPAGDLERRLDLARLVQALDFGPAGSGLAWAYAGLLGIAAGIAIVGAVRDLLAAIRARRRDGMAWSLGTLLFALHAGLVLTVLTILALKMSPPGESAGVEARRLPGMALSLLVLAAVGIGRAAGPIMRRVQAALGIGLCGLGLVGLVMVIDKPTPPAQRGECYEWFLPQISRHADRDADTVLATVARVDRGDRRFAVLRFSVDWPDLAEVDPATLASERAAWAAARDERSLYRAAAVGRALIAAPAGLATVAMRKELALLEGCARAALWHGAGIAIPAARPGIDAGQYRTRLAAVEGLCKSLHAADARLVAEGYGFARGFGIDPYSESLVRQLADFRTFDASLQAALYRGAGWGYRQRWIDPPVDEPPEGLIVLAAVPLGAREAFLDGLLARRLPPEATCAAPPR